MFWKKAKTYHTIITYKSYYNADIEGKQGEGENKAGMRLVSITKSILTAI
jgi:hypothetical protein